MKQHIKHFNLCAKAASNGNKDYAINYLQSMLRSAMSNKAAQDIKAELAKYL